MSAEAAELPDPPVRSLVIHWTPDTSEIELDRQGLSCFDVVGLLQVALEIAECDLPIPYIPDPEESS